MKILITIVKRILDKDTPALLGRWNLDYCPKLVKHKVDWANEDHCSSCTQNMVKKEEKNTKILDLE